ncbi:MAG: right-handed parallel beta-helix repeat-containing protein [Sciscionella sp.]
MTDDRTESRAAPWRTRLHAVFALLTLAVTLTVTFAIVRLTGADPAVQGQPLPTATAKDMPLAVTMYPAPDDAVFVSPKGSDRASGSAGSPLRTVRAAIERAPSGATVVLRGGTYREGVGTLDKRLTIQPFPGERVWLKGSLVVSDWSHTGAVWEHRGWRVDLCERCFLPGIVDAAHPLAGLPDMVFLDGTPLRQVDERTAVGSGTFYVDTRRHSLVIGDDPTGKVVESAAFGHLVQLESGAAGSVIRGIGIAEYASNQDYGNHGAMVIVNAPNVTLERNTFGWSASSGAIVVKPKANVVGNSFLDNGLAGMVANRADGLRMTANRFVGNNQEQFSLSGDSIGAAGAKVTKTKRPYVADNYFVNNDSNGWWCDLGCTDAIVIRNVARGNAVNGLYYEVSARALIASNIVLDNAKRGLKISSSDRVRVYNNTFAGNSVDVGLYNDPRSPSFDRYSERLGLPWVTEQTMLVNNLFANRGSGGPVIESGGDKPRQPRSAFVSVSDGNAYLLVGNERSEPLVTWSRGSGRFDSYDSLADFRRATGQEAHGTDGMLDSIPFHDRASGDYRLRRSVPGVDAGLPLPADMARTLDLSAEQHPDIGALSGPHRA